MFALKGLAMSLTPGTKLGREVAVKVLPEAFAETKSAWPGLSEKLGSWPR